MKKQHKNSGTGRRGPTIKSDLFLSISRTTSQSTTGTLSFELLFQWQINTKLELSQIYHQENTQHIQKLNYKYSKN